MTAAIPDAADIQFHELCLWLERAFPQPGGLGATTAPRQERVRFRANPILAFPAEEIASIEPPADPADPVVVTANLFGLYGPSSPLPPSLTERVILAEEAGALRDFLDLFNHRLLSLLFLAWKTYRHPQSYRPGATDPISRAVAALFGMGVGEMRTARPLLMPYAGILSLESRPAVVLAAIVGDLLGVPCAVEEFVRREIAIPEDALWRLGAPSCLLGCETVIGDSMGDVAGQFRVRLGPLDAARCNALLPDGEDHRLLVEVIALSIRDPLEWDLAFALQPGEAQPFYLGDNRLGWASWLGASDDFAAEFAIQL